MNDRLTTVLAEVNRKGWAPLSAIQPSPFDSNLLGNALGVAPGQSLMHYLRLERLKDLLRNGALYMRRLDLFELDPHEGQFPAANTHQQSSLTQGFAEQLGLAPDRVTGASPVHRRPDAQTDLRALLVRLGQ